MTCMATCSFRGGGERTFLATWGLTQPSSSQNMSPIVRSARLRAPGTWSPPRDVVSQSSDPLLSGVTYEEGWESAVDGLGNAITFLRFPILTYGYALAVTRLPASGDEWAGPVPFSLPDLKYAAVSLPSTALADDGATSLAFVQRAPSGVTMRVSTSAGAGEASAGPIGHGGHRHEVQGSLRERLRRGNRAPSSRSGSASPSSRSSRPAGRSSPSPAVRPAGTGKGRRRFDRQARRRPISSAPTSGRASSAWSSPAGSRRAPVSPISRLPCAPVRACSGASRSHCGAPVRPPGRSRCPPGLAHGFAPGRHLLTHFAFKVHEGDGMTEQVQRTIRLHA